MPARFQFTWHLKRGTGMASDTEDSEAAADRLETALERIAQAAVRGEVRPPDQHPPVDTKEIAAQLDDLIDRLRAALADKVG